MDIELIKSRIIAEIEDRKGELWELSLKIHSNPELGFQENKASNWLTSLLQQCGFEVELNIHGLPTAFRASYGQGRPIIALLAEYDALPGLGHGCGHNLIATSSLGAALGARKAIDQFGGTLMVLGTPAEESLGGKILMANQGAFDGLDAAMIVHPGNHDSVVTEALALQGLKVEFFGKASHAAAKPEEGINALEALILSFNAINSLRQHIPSSARIHGIISEGGRAPNIVPDYSAASFMVRATDVKGLENIKQRVLDCFVGAAAATGARLEYKWDDLCYLPMLNNLTLGRLFLRNLLRFRKKAKMEDPDKGFGSTDFGNVSQIVPGVHAGIAIAPPGVVTHSPRFAEAAASDDGRLAMLDAAKTLALTVADLVAVPGLLLKAKDEFDRNKQL